jgi:hypothetical protein
VRETERAREGERGRERERETERGGGGEERERGVPSSLDIRCRDALCEQVVPTRLSSKEAAT